MPVLIDLEELDTLQISAFLITDHHEDHLDAECIQRKKSIYIPFNTPPDTIKQLIELGVSTDCCFLFLFG